MARIIYSLEFELEPDEDGRSRHLIAPLDRSGNAVYTRPVPPKKRTIDIRAGDWLMFRGEAFRVLDVRAYRENYGDVEILERSKDGYVVKHERLREQVCPRRIAVRGEACLFALVNLAIFVAEMVKLPLAIVVLRSASALLSRSSVSASLIRAFRALNLPEARQTPLYA